jgi:hypothetical protein
MTEEPDFKMHRFCAIHRCCLDCGATGRAVLTGKRPCDCPGGVDTSITAITHVLAERKFQRGQQAYSKGFPAPC